MKTAILLLLSIVTFALASGQGGMTGPDQPYLINFGVYQLKIFQGDTVSVSSGVYTTQSDSVAAGDYRDSIWIPNTPDARGYSGVLLRYYTNAATTLNWIVVRPTFDLMRCKPVYGGGLGSFIQKSTCYGDTPDTLGYASNTGTERVRIDMAANKYGAWNDSLRYWGTQKYWGMIPTTTNGAKQYWNRLYTSVTGVPITGWWIVASTTNYHAMILIIPVVQ